MFSFLGILPEKAWQAFSGIEKVYEEGRLNGWHYISPFPSGR